MGLGTMVNNYKIKLATQEITTITYEYAGINMAQMHKQVQQNAQIVATHHTLTHECKVTVLL